MYDDCGLDRSIVITMIFMWPSRLSLNSFLVSRNFEEGVLHVLVKRFENKASHPLDQ